ncbi:MAG: hypothetical protein FRX48_08450 [Lasallia pustulata]|uniref:Uncharacterized protein n=1 Tax=Lasallia pustulata TaxID=136370 RepID=A0A5M8PFU7_9LECA|nr:MAG: hypothetical protein FRX48_08450 [Lasallia pustulata]
MGWGLVYIEYRRHYYAKRHVNQHIHEAPLGNGIWRCSSSSPPQQQGNLPTDKVVLPDADDEEEEGDTIVVANKAPGPLTPQASKGKGNRKRAPTAVVSGAMPDWASPGR